MKTAARLWGPAKYLGLEYCNCHYNRDIVTRTIKMTYYHYRYLNWG
jgi:hypothetical protein